MNVYPDIEKREKTKRAIEKLTEEYQKLNESIELDEAGILKKYGVHCEQVFSKVFEPTGKFYASGKEKMQSKYVLADNVRYDSDNNEYIVTINDEGDMEVAPIKDENNNEGTPCDCEECTCEEPAEDIPEEIAKDLDDMDAVNATDGPVEVEQEEQEEHAQPEVTFEEQFAF